MPKSQAIPMVPTTSLPAFPNLPGSGAGVTAAKVGLGLVGKTQYVWGGGRNDADVKAGNFDCSGFVDYAFKQAGIDLGGANTDGLLKKGVRVNPSQIQPGDLVFFDTYKKNGHVGIYLGNGKFIGSQSKTGVAVADMTSGYFKDHFNGVVVRIGGNTIQPSLPMGKYRSIYGNDYVNASSAPASTYTNTWKTKKEALQSPGYQEYKKNLAQAVQMGAIPQSWVVGLTELVGRESNWNPHDKNPTSTAYGYGQFLKSTRAEYEKKMGLSYDNPLNQLIMLGQYIKDRYGDINNALKFWDAHNWF